MMVKIKFLDAHRFTTLLTSKNFPSVSFWLLWSRSHWNNASLENKRRTRRNSCWIVYTQDCCLCRGSYNLNPTPVSCVQLSGQHYVVEITLFLRRKEVTWTAISEHLISPIKCIFISKPLFRVCAAESWSWWSSVRLAGCRSESTSDDALLAACDDDDDHHIAGK